MTATAARIGYGSTFEISTDGGATFAPIGEVKSITPPSDTVDVIDATHMTSPNATREFVLGLNDPGESSFEMNFIPGSLADQTLQAVRAARAVVTCRITFPNAQRWTFLAIMTGYEPTNPMDDLMVATVTFKVTGSYGVSTASAPANTTLPAVAGVAQEGQVVTALEGVWTNAPTSFAYQWQELISAVWTNIAGATAKTLTVPGSSTVGRPIRVQVTATNSAGSATASSAQTPAVLAA
jgi:hypothetical protein